MVYTAMFIALASAELLSILLIFIFKDIVHSVLALATNFFINSLLFLMLDQPLLALIQLFIMVGGISTYLFVGIAPAGFSRFKRTSYILLLILSIAFFTACFYRVTSISFPVQQQNLLSGQALTTYLTSGIGQLYIITFVLFGVALGSIVILRKIDGIK